MKNEDFSLIMNDEIKKRMESNAWNFKIASKVLEKRNKKRRFIIYSASVSSFALAALVMIIFMFGINSPQVPVPGQYNKFITKQLQGTYKDVFKDKKNVAVTKNNMSTFIAKQLSGTYSDVFKDNKVSSISLDTSDILLSSSVDSLIDDTLSIR